MNRFDQLADLQDRLTIAEMHAMNAYLLGYLMNGCADEQWAAALAAAELFMRGVRADAGRGSVTA